MEGLDASTADALGISRAILCNDSLIRKLKGLDQKNQTVKVINYFMSFISDTSLFINRGSLCEQYDLWNFIKVSMDKIT